MVLLGPAGTLPGQCHVDSAKVVPRAPQKDGGGAEECRQMSVGEWTSKWRRALRLHRVPLENDATKSSSLVGSCSVGLWRGRYPWHARAPLPSSSPGPLLSIPGLAASFSCLHLFLAVETTLLPKRLPKTLLLPRPSPDRKPSMVEVTDKSSQACRYTLFDYMML